MRLQNTFTALLFLLIGFVLPRLYARSLTIMVEDLDLALPLEGALIRSWDGAEYTCDENGAAVINAPDDREAVIQIAYPGYETARLRIAPDAEAEISVGLRLTGIMESYELVIEADPPGTGEARSGRSAAISGEELARVAEIGIVEDVMSAVKLLPGVGYAGMFNAMPSIRGGEPGDLSAVLDGFTIENPYHYGGGVSIFDPRMVSSAVISHGVFSTRYGHTISGLLEVQSRRPSPDHIEMELGLSSSAANLNLSFPFWGKGGLMVMGKLTYWDPFVALAKLFIEEARYVSIAPYIRAAAFSGNYRFSENIELTANGFIGADGGGAEYRNRSDGADGIANSSDISIDYGTSQGFLISGLRLNPFPAMALRFSGGLGFWQSDIDGTLYYRVSVPYSEDFKHDYADLIGDKAFYTLEQFQTLREKNRVNQVQGRLDLDWDLGGGFLAALGVHELYSQWTLNDYFNGVSELPMPKTGFETGFEEGYLNLPMEAAFTVENHGLNSAVYTLLEYADPQRDWGLEAGLRMDHLAFNGKDFSIQTLPTLNPRMNVDWGLVRNKGILESLSATVGTGLFSSVNDDIRFIQSGDGIDDYELKQNRSWTSVLGAKFDFTGPYSFNIEAYYKHIFDRAYTVAQNDVADQTRRTDFLFDGEGRVWGFDLIAQKSGGRYWDGWLSYTFTQARYRNPQSDTYTQNWFYPSFHRFHNLNLVLNLKPGKRIGIAARFGLASGRPRSVQGEIQAYPVAVLDRFGKPVMEDGKPLIIQKYKRLSLYDEEARTTWSIPIDLKFSFYFYNPSGKTRGEFYLAVENLASLFYRSKTNTSFNAYTGEEDTGALSGTYEMPFPLPSIGFKWTY
jgi:hypothetical protein